MSNPTTTTDPHGWVKSPPSTFVTIHGTSRDGLNGCRGLILSYDSSKGRYLTLLVVNQQQVSLKVENLKIAGLIDQGKAYLELWQHSPELQAQVRRVTTVLRKRCGSVDPKYVMIGGAVTTILSCLFMGISKTFLLLTVLMLLIMIVGPDVMDESKDLPAIVRNAPMRWKNLVREQVPKFGPMIAANDLYFYAFTGIVVFLTIFPLLKSGGGGKNNQSSSSSATASSTPYDDNAAVSPEHYYKLGYDDAKANLDFGASLTEAIAAAAQRRSLVDGDDNDGEEVWNGQPRWATMTPVEPSSSSSSQLFSVSTAMAIFAIVRTVYPLGVVNNGGQQRWDYQLAVANFRTLPTWRLAILGFALYRLFAAVVG